MGHTSPALADFPHPMVRLACSRCSRRGQYRKAALIEEYGGENTLPDLRHLVTSCDRHGKLGDACGVYYQDLAAKD
jgi:hypothetical protein